MMKITEEKQPADEPPSNGTNNVAPSHGTPNSLPSHVMDQSMYGATDAMMANVEQSYEQFMQSFIVLTPEDVLAARGVQSDRDPNSSASHDLCIAASHDGSLRQDVTKASTPLNEADSLDEEVLGTGTTTSSISHGAVGKLRGLKIDNFVDDETSSLSEESDEGIEDKCMEYSGYQASFSREEPTHKNEQTHSITAPEETDPCGDSFRNSTQMDVKAVNPKDQNLLSNNLSNVSASVSTEVNSDQSSDTESDLVYDQRFDRLNPGEVDTDIERSDVKEVHFRTMGYSARPGDPSESEPTKPLEGTTVRGVNCDTEEADCTCTPCQESDDVTTYDAVEPFVLDESFDYDNVILTPKYTAEEMEQIMSSLAKGPVYVPPPSSDTEEDS